MSDIQSTYRQALNQAQLRIKELKKKSTWISIARFTCLLLILIPLYFYLYDFDTWLLLLSISGLVFFLFFVSKHQSVKNQIKYFQVQEDQAGIELQFLENNHYPFRNGDEFRSSDDLYEQDLDLYGDHSLFQYLNRTHSYEGYRRLGLMLRSEEVDTAEILSRQEVCKDLMNRSDFRRDFQIQTELADLDERTSYRLEKWSEKKTSALPKLWIVLMYAVPILYAVAIIMQLSADSFGSVWNVMKYGSGTLLLMLISQLKKIRTEVVLGDKIGSKIQAISGVWKLIETQNFTSPLLIQLQSKGKDHSSTKLDSLAGILRNLETINNPLGALLINAFFPFHLFYYDKLVKWKVSNPDFLGGSPQRIGVWESYVSLSQYAYNHPQNHFPSYDDQLPLSISQGRHPLMRVSESVANDIDFGQYKFFILTGSNMSGKSTFLRTIGTIMVLGKLGLRVPVTTANLHSQPLYASMRISDSLSDQASYFYAELKKLKAIMQQSERGPAFVLLDEILRGTNSDDKRTGTIDVIQKFLQTQCHGIIATHDLEVCRLADLHPNLIHNICFESVIENGELHFDYKLRDGICQNKNATFLMQKMGIID